MTAGRDTRGGRPVEVSHARVLAIAAPMTLAHLSTPLLGVADTAVIGQLGDAALIGAVALGSVIFDFVFWGFGFLRMGTTGLTAQAVGAGDDTEMRASLARALLIAAACGVALAALQWPVGEIAHRAMGASPAVDAAAREYFAIRIWSAPLAFANYAILGWFLGRGEAGTGLLLQVFLNGLNICLNVALVLGLGMGVAGVALGTVIGEAATVVLGGALAWRALGGRLSVPRAVVLDRARMVATVAVGRDIMIRSLSLVFAFAFFAAQGARLGDVQLAANAVLMNLFLVGAYFLDGIATAAEQLCGAAVGARNRAAFRRAVALASLWGVGLALSLGMAVWLGGGGAVDLMTTSEEVRAAARTFLPYAALTPVLGVMAFVYDGVYVGATWGAAMRNLMIASLAVFLAAWAVLTPAFGNHGLWAALLVFLGARGLFQGLALPGLARRSFPAG